jgi:hypothetical protein
MPKKHTNKADKTDNGITPRYFTRPILQHSYHTFTITKDSITFDEI